MIDGLKLTMTGEEIRGLIEQRAAEHRKLATDWNREAARTAEEQTEDNPLMPEHMCENEAGRHQWRAEVLTFLRDHLDPFETYRLNECDLDFAELLPEPPAWLEQDGYEGASLGPFARCICDSPEIEEIVSPDVAAGGDHKRN